MKTSLPITLTIAAVAALASLAAPSAGRAEDGIDKAKAAAFDARMFERPIAQKTYACFVRRYDAAHLAQHPKQKVGAMKLLVSAEVPAEEQQTTNYSFRMGVKYRHRTGNFDSSGYCNHAVAEDAPEEIRLGCGVDCDGGGIQVAMAKDDKSAIVRLERVVVWDRNKPDAEDRKELTAGADDKMFRVDRADMRECLELITDKEELLAFKKQHLAALRQK